MEKSSGCKVLSFDGIRTTVEYEGGRYVSVLNRSELAHYTLAGRKIIELKPSVEFGNKLLFASLT